MGQVTNAVRYWVGGTNVVLGQSYSYLFDDIGNRTTSRTGFQPVSSDYTANLLNQYTQRTIPGSFWELGHAHSGATVTVNQVVAGRQAALASEKRPTSASAAAKVSREFGSR